MDNLWQDDSELLELRTYALHPGRRDELIDLFERELLETQEAAGLRVLGQLRALDAPDCFVWLRGHGDAARRAERLSRFYDGPVWRAHRDAANSTMVSSDDVLLLEPAAPGTALRLPAHRPAPGEPAPQGVWLATTLLQPAAVDGARRARFAREVVPLLSETGARLAGCYTASARPNDFPRHPVREGLFGLVWFASFESEAACRAHLAALQQDLRWQQFSGGQEASHQVLAATARSRLGAPVRGDPAALNLELAERLLFGRAPALPSPQGDVHDFDFLAGDWDVDNRRLAQRGVGSCVWLEFAGNHRLARYLGGVANVDQLDLPTLGRSGMSVRTFDLAARRWTIQWIDSKSGALFAPVHGGFTGDRGEFYGADVEGGAPVRVRFTWTWLGAGRARWEQAFDHGDGQWETNWVMEFRRPR
jgi:hypothetical protein